MQMSNFRKFQNFIVHSYQSTKENVSNDSQTELTIHDELIIFHVNTGNGITRSGLKVTWVVPEKFIIHFLAHL